MKITYCPRLSHDVNKSADNAATVSEKRRISALDLAMRRKPLGAMKSQGSDNLLCNY